jgi:membrane-associated phospholipid phosphatase
VTVPTPLPALRRRVLVAGLLLLALGAALSVLIGLSGTRPAVQRVDDTWYRWMVAARWPALVTVSKVLSTAFGTAVEWPIRTVVAILLAWRRRWLALASWVVTLAVSESMIGPIKNAVDRPRPPGSLIATSAASYPSGHAIASAVTAIGIVMALTSGRRRLHWMILAVAVATTVALSRTYLSAHWLSDVVGGAFLGGGVALAVPEGFEVARDRHRARERRRALPLPDRDADEQGEQAAEQQSGAGARGDVERVVRAEVDPGEAGQQR